MNIDGRGRKGLICTGCYETDRKLFVHIDTERDVRSSRGHGIKIYQCKICGEHFSQMGRYDGGDEGILIIRDDCMAMDDGFNLMFNDAE